jgi:alpha/beta superfamily hydrolase
VRERRGHIFFSGDDRLEGILEWPEGAAAGRLPGTTGASASGSSVAGGVVVAHPHPLYGGTMAQPVVYRMAQACRERGFVSLRFNFRGVGQSLGRYSGSDEYRDVEAAAAFLRGRLGDGTAPGELPGRRSPLALAGYSFGSMMVALAAADGAVPVDALALVALVVRWEEWEPGTLDGLARFEGPVLAVCGEADDLAPPESVERTLARLGLDFRLVVVPGTGHFFEHRQREVGEKVAAFFTDTLRTPRSMRLLKNDTSAAGPP